MSPSRPLVSPARCRTLRSLRNRYGAADTAAKLALLTAIASHGVSLRSWTALNTLHEDLLFLRAFPDSAEVHRVAVAALDRMEPALRRLSARQRAVAADSGVSGSVTNYTHPFAVARWLASVAPLAAEIDWKAADTERLDALIRLTIERGEEDGFDGGDLSTRDWMRLARDVEHESALAWLMASVRRAHVVPAIFSRLYDALPVPVRWSLAHSPWSVTHNALAVPRVTPRTSMRRAPENAPREIGRPLSGIALLTPRDGARVIDVARAALAARSRETFALNHANAREVWMAPLGEGASLAIMGVAPDDRLSLESHYSYVLLSNGVPIGYGGVTPLFHQANTGINIFDPYRGSEAAFLWTQMLRAFHSLFGVTRFVVNAMQFGEDNEEAIASGAYWFYWRLGFRPVSRELRRYAEAEAKRLAASPGKRSSARTLRHLATGDLHLVLPGTARAPFFDEAWLTDVSSRVTRLLEEECPHDHARAARQLAQRAAEALGVRIARWPAAECAAFVRLAPVVALVEPEARWTRGDRTALASVMRAKGAPQERGFVRAAQTNRLLFATLVRALGRGSRGARGGR